MPRRRKFTGEQVAKYDELRRTGLSHLEAAERAGIPKTVASEWKKHANQ